MNRPALALIFLCALPANADEYLAFHSPSGNIQCAIFTFFEARCDILDISAPIPDPPADCELDYGHAFGIGSLDAKGYRICAGEPVADPGGLTLGYGDHIDLGGFRCTSEKTGMTCTNAAGHGFSLSKRAQRLF